MKRIRKLQQQSNFESLFWDDEFSHPLRLLFQKASKLTNSIVERHIHTLKAIQETDSEFFWQEAAASNLLAFLHLFIGEDQLALDQLQLSLEHAPNNLNAILGMIRILETQKRNYSDAEEKVDQYTRLRENSEEMEKQVLICRGEIAYACSFTGADFYTEAVDRYEALLREDSKDELSGYVIRWQYHLAYTYNRMLNKGHSEALVKKLSTMDMAEVFDKVSNLYDVVIRSDDKFYQGKAMIDLVDTYKKCETFGNRQKLKFLYDCGPDEYVKRAMDTAPSDPHVLERCGRHYRQRASSRQELEEAVEIFDGLLASHPFRFVALHHKGLACRALWHVVGKYEQAKLYNNSARKGNKRGVRTHRRGQAPHVGGTSAAKCHQTDDPVLLVPGEDTCGPTSPQNTSANEEQDIHSSSRKLPRNAPRQLPTLRPRNPRGRQLKKPDFFDRLRTSNPLAKDDRSRKYLEQAKECFERAKQMTKGTCSPYIVDLARTMISLGMCGDAEKEFEAADKLGRTMNDNDAAYLFEQWAILRHNLTRRSEETSEKARGQMKDVASIYRQAILHAVRSREKSRMAFYNLRDLLSKELELEHEAGNAALRMEYEVLYSSAERYGECGEMLVRALENDQETRDTAWQLVTILHDRGHPHDPAAAFTYLTALHEAGQLELDEDQSSTDTELSIRELLVDVVWQLVDNRRREELRAATEVRDIDGQLFREIFRWIVGERRLSDHIRLDPDSPRPFADSGEVCVLAPSCETPGVDRVVSVLRDLCSVAVVKGFSDGNCDIRFGGATSEGLRSVVAISQSVVVVVDCTDAVNWRQLLPVLDELLTVDVDRVNMCLVADKCVDCSEIERRYDERWPLIHISDDDDDVELAHTLLRTLLCTTRRSRCNVP